MGKNVTLSEKQFTAISLLMRSLPVAEVAEETGVNRVTIYRWLKEDLFNAELDKRKNELIRRSSRKLAGKMDKAIDVLDSLLISKQQNTRRLAAVNLIDYCIKFSDNTDIEKRIEALEKASENKK